MPKLIDKHLLFVTSLLFILAMSMGYETVIITLIALSVMELTTYFYPKNMWQILFLLFCVGCIIKPFLLFFLPVLLYEFAETKKWYGYISIILFFINISMFTEPWQILLWWIIVVFTTILAIRTTNLCNQQQALITLRDNSVESERQMKIRNKELIERQDYEIHVATLSERNRIAREIHDNVGHMLSRCILQIGALMTIHKKDELLYEQLSSVNSSLNEAMNNIRESVHDLHDESIDLKQSILDATSEIKKTHTVNIEYDMDNQTPRNIKYCIIAIIKEAMSNIIKHSNASKINIMLREHPAFYQLAIEDNGSQIIKNMNPGIGLSNMQERVESLGGTINFNIENGFKIMVFIKKENKNEGNCN